MTVCLAALANDGGAIVCIADKALSYGDYIQWDSDSTKMIEINPSGSIILFSGEEQATSRVLGGMLAREGEIGRDLRETVKLCEEEYKAAMDELVEGKFLRPRLLTRKEYVAAITSGTVNAYIMSVAKEINSFEMDCSLLVCGFTAPDKPFILSVTNPGIVTDMTTTGFHAIGSGWEKALSRLLFSDFSRANNVERILYDAFDAKANAEMAVGVGYAWDARVIVYFDVGHPQGPLAIVPIEKRIKEIIERAWSKHNRSPFQTKKEPDDLPHPPKDWKEQLQNYIVETVLTRWDNREKAKAAKSGSNSQPPKDQP